MRFRLEKPFFYLLALFGMATLHAGTSLVVTDVRLVSNNLVCVRFSDGSSTAVKVEPELAPGEERMVKFRLRGSVFYIRAEGERSDMPVVLISEFTTKGTRNNQDKVELFILSSGNLDGMVIDYNHHLLELGNVPVRKNDYVVFELPEGLSQNNGYIEIRSSASSVSRIVDKVVYSVKDDDKTSPGWVGRGIDPTGSTTTRSMNRKKDADGAFADTDSAADFYITVTRGATFGKSNDGRAFEKKITLGHSE